MTYNEAERICKHDSDFQQGQQLIRRVMAQANLNIAEMRTVENMVLSMLATAFILGYTRRSLTL